MHHFCFPDLGKEKLCSILVFGNACFNIIVRINHDNVASRGLLDVLTPLPDSRQASVEKIERRIFRGFRICVGYISTTRFCVVGFMCPINISLFWVYSASILCLFCVYIPATTPRATTPHLYRTGYHAFTTCTATTLSLSRYHATVLCSIPGLSHLSYHAPPHTYIGLSHPP